MRKNITESSQIQTKRVYRSLNRKRARLLPLPRLIIIGSIGILLIVIAIIGARAMQSHKTAIEQGSVSIERLNDTISEHVKLTFLAADLTLRRAVERQYFNALFGNNLYQDMENNFLKWVEETPQISAMLMTDETGKITAIQRKQGFETWMGGRESVGSMPYFTYHSESTEPDMLYVGWMQSYIKGNDGFVGLSRRINKLDGSFGGVVLVAVNGDYISNFFRSIETNRRSQMVLMRNDHEPLINQVRDDSEMQRLQSEMKSATKNPALSGGKAIVSPKAGYGNAVRIYAFREIPAFQMLIGVVGYGDDILSPWRMQIANDMVIMAMFLLVVGIAAWFTITLTKQISRAQRSERAAVLASQAKSDFLANMSHELRTPLNAIIGFSEMMAAGYFGKLNSKQLERTNDMNSCGTHLLSLINDILEFSKGEAGKIELRNEKVSVPKAIRDVVRILNEKARREGISLVATTPDNATLVIADERKIKQILLNLVSNSLKFTSKGGMVEARSSLDERGNYVFTVTDTGKGMRESDIPKALSAFGQVHEDPAHGGTGLGLPLCKMFAELHGGELAIQSIEGVGTKVTITLPAERVLKPGQDIPLRFRPPSVGITAGTKGLEDKLEGEGEGKAENDADQPGLFEDVDSAQKQETAKENL